MRQTLSPPLARLNGWEEEAERIIGLGGRSREANFLGPDPGVGLGGSAVVGDPGTPQQLHLTSALLGQMAGAGWVKRSHAKTYIPVGRRQDNPCLPCLANPLHSTISMALLAKCGALSRGGGGESVCIDFYHE